MNRFALLLLLCAAPAFAGDGLAPPIEAQAPAGEGRVDQRLGEQVPLDLSFADEAGNPITLREASGGKTTILLLAYYRCPHLCTQVLTHLLDQLKLVNFTAGKDFNIVVVSFDYKETHKLAADKKQTYVDAYSRPGAEAGWRFLTARKDEGKGKGKETIQALCDAIGFKFVFDKVFKEYDHPSAVMVMTPEGKLSRYFLDVLMYTAKDMKLALVEAGDGQVGSPADTVWLRCFSFDPHTGKYTPNVMAIVRTGGALTLAALAAFYAVSWFRRPKTPTPAAGPHA